MKKHIYRFTIDTSITFITRILQFAVSIGISIIIARILGPKGQGFYSLAILFPSLLASFGNLGIGQASVFYLGKKKYSPKQILSNNITLSLLLGIGAFLIGWIIILFFAELLFPGIAKAYLFLGLSLTPLVFFLNLINYVLLGLQKIKEFNFISIFQSLILLIILSIFLLVFKLGIKATIAANFLSCLIATIVLFYLTKNIIKSPSLSFNKSYLKDAIQYGFKVFLGNVITFLHYRIDIFLLNMFLNPLAVGFYSIAVVLSEKIWLVSQSVGIVLFPKVSSERNQKILKEFTPFIFRSVLTITAIGAILLFFLGNLLIVFFYSERFSASIIPFRILLIGTVTMSGWRILANDLYGRGRPEINIRISLISLVLNIILNVFWIPKYGLTGAAWATSVSYVFAFVLITIIYSKISGNSICKTVLIQKTDFSLYKGLAISLVPQTDAK